jgi:hypothetical protein
MRRAFSFAFVVGLFSCGGQTLTTPESLRIDTYSKNTPFTLTFVMTSCRDACATYETPECVVEVTDKTITVEVEVPYSREGDTCIEVCAGEVIAHCNVSPLPAGTYTVESGSFRKTIDVI